MSSWLPPSQEIKAIVDRAILEDLGNGDITTDALVSPDLLGEGVIISKEEGVLAGMPVADLVFQQVDPSLSFDAVAHDGDRIKPKNVLATVKGSVSSILKGERVALNFLQRLSGVATVTSRYVEAVGELPVRVIDTRKTTPGLRSLEKYAVRVGGGFNHRRNLGDGILVKDNHLEAARIQGLSMKEVVQQLRLKAPHTLKIQIEVTSFEQAMEALAAGADALLLDNMKVEEMRRVAQAVKGRIPLEASGGITLANARAVAETGVNFMSAGALTHSVKALDMSLELNYLP